MSQGINGSHSWRQSDTASVARNFSHHPRFPSPEIFLFPRIDTLSLSGDLRGITGMEFPLYQAVVSFFFTLSNTDHDFWGLIVSALSGVAILLGLLHLFPTYRALFICLSLFSIPIFLKWAHKFMPEMFALALILWGLYFYGKKNMTGYIFAGVLLLGGTIARPFLIFLNLPLLMDFIQGMRKKESLFSLKTFAPLVIGIIIIGSLFAWYGYHSPYLVKTYGISYFLTPSLSWKKIGFLINADSYIFLSKAFFYHYANLVFFLPFLWGIMLIFKERSLMPLERDMLGAAILSLAILPFLVDPHFLLIHPYYLMACIPAVVIIFNHFLKMISLSQLFLILFPSTILAFFLRCVLDGEKPGHLIVNFIMPVTFLALYKFHGRFLKKRHPAFIIATSLCTFILYAPVGWYFGKKYIKVKPSSLAAARNIREEVWRKTHPDELLVLHDDNHSSTLYQLRRRGIVTSKKTVQSLLKDPTGKKTIPFQKFGVKWILYSLDNNNYTLKRLITRP